MGVNEIMGSVRVRFTLVLPSTAFVGFLVVSMLDCFILKMGLTISHRPHIKTV